MSYKISIIVPHFKTELYIHKCIDSILVQTLMDFELILVNDGSPDECGKICNEYAEKDSRIKVIHKENGGYSSAINAGLDIAQGEYIGIVDGDDYIEKDMYKTLYNLAKEYDADVAECNFYVVKGSDIIPIEQNEKIQVGDNLFALDILLKKPFHNVVWNKIYRKNLFSKLRFPEGKMYSDGFIVYKILLSLNKYVYTSECKYFYLKRANSIMAQSEYSLKMLDGLESQEERFYYLKERINDSSILSLAEYRYFHEILHHYQMLSINNELDPNKEYRKMVKNHLINNYSSFKRNKLLADYRIWITIFSLNGALFNIFYRFHLRGSNWYYDTKCKLIRFVKGKLMKQTNE